MNDLIRDLLELLQAVLGPDLVGVYLYGSAAAGDFDLKRSDVDLVVVCASEPGTRFPALERMHHELILGHRDWNDRIDIIYVSAATLREQGVDSGSMVVVSPGEPLHLAEISEKWQMNWYLVREQGATLLGPAARGVFPTVTQDEFVASVRTHLRSWPDWIAHSDRPGFHTYAVLTMCRALHACHTGRQLSKIQAASWALREFPEWSGVIEQALAWRVSPATGSPDAVDFVKFAVNRLSPG